MNESDFAGITSGLHTQHNEFDCWPISIKNAIVELSKRTGERILDNISITKISNCIEHAPKLGPNPETFEKGLSKFFEKRGYRVETDYGRNVTSEKLREFTQKENASLPLVTLSLDYRTEYGFRVERPKPLDDGTTIVLDHVVLVIAVTDDEIWFFDPYIELARHSPRFVGRHYIGKIAFESYWENAYRPNWYMRLIRSRIPTLDAKYPLVRP